MLYGVVGFYFLDKKHFHIDFNIFQSFRYTLQNFFLIGSSDLIPRDSFARDFIYLIKISGFASISFLVYSLVRPYVFKITTTEEENIESKISDTTIWKFRSRLFQNLFRQIYFCTS